MTRRLIGLANLPGADFWEHEIDALPEAKRVFRSIWELDGEVNNGGFEQFFFNSSATSAPYSVSALQIIGAPVAAAIVNEAVALVGDLSWKDDDRRREQMVALPDAIFTKLRSLNEAFSENLTTLLYAYVEQHRDEIGATSEF